MHIPSAVDRLKIGVFMGGKSIEREVSFNSGRTICDHLDTTKYDVIPVFQTEDGALYILPWHFLHRGKIADFQHRLAGEATRIAWDDLKERVDFIYLAVHGRYAEDGTIQGMLEVLEIPYLGSKVFGSALGMDKIKQKEILAHNGIDVPRGISIDAHEVNSITCENIIERLKALNIQAPYIVKPAHEGSSMGISCVKEENNLLDAVRLAAHTDARQVQSVLIEEKLVGMEFVCVSLQKMVYDDQGMHSEWWSFPITEVIPEEKSFFYDYEQKYMPGRATKITPARCNEQLQESIKTLCINASNILNFSTISRIDGFITSDGRCVIIDPNTLTGMSPATFLFHQAAEVGMSHTILINFLIEHELRFYGLGDVVVGKNHEGIVVSESNEKNVRIAVLLGGNSNEREISLESGRNVCYKLSPNKYDITPLFVDDQMRLYKLDQRLLIKNSTREIAHLVTPEMQVKWANLPNMADFVFLGLHGGMGENGSIQGALEMLGLPYNGPGVLASALCMDKFKTNSFLRSHGFNVPNSMLIDRSDWVGKNKKEQEKYITGILKSYSYPFILKPFDDGCSLFVSKIKNDNELIQKLDEFFSQTQKPYAMLEELIVGMELTCGVFGNNEDVVALPPSRAVANKEILSIEEKFLPGAGENQTPAPLPQDALDLVRSTVKDAYRTIGCVGYSRIDCFYQDAQQSLTGQPRVIILEFNTLPALTPATCLFHQAAEIGLRPMEFIDKIIDLGFAHHKKIDTSIDTSTNVLPKQDLSSGQPDVNNQESSVSQGQEQSPAMILESCDVSVDIRVDEKPLETENYTMSLF